MICTYASPSPRIALWSARSMSETLAPSSSTQRHKISPRRRISWRIYREHDKHGPAGLHDPLVSGNIPVHSANSTVPYPRVQTPIPTSRTEYENALT